MDVDSCWQKLVHTISMHLKRYLVMYSINKMAVLVPIFAARNHEMFISVSRCLKDIFTRQYFSVFFSFYSRLSPEKKCRGPTILCESNNAGSTVSLTAAQILLFTN